MQAVATTAHCVCQLSSPRRGPTGTGFRLFSKRSASPMAGEETKAAEVAEDPELLEDDDSLMGQIKDWVRTQAPWWATSFTIHMVALSTLLLLGRVIAPKQEGESPAFDTAEV